MGYFSQWKAFEKCAASTQCWSWGLGIRPNKPKCGWVAPRHCLRLWKNIFNGCCRNLSWLYKMFFPQYHPTGWKFRWMDSLDPALLFENVWDGGMIATLFFRQYHLNSCGSVYESKNWHSSRKYRRRILRCNRNSNSKQDGTISHVDGESLKKRVIQTVNSRSRRTDWRSVGCSARRFLYGHYWCGYRRKGSRVGTTLRQVLQLRYDECLRLPRWNRNTKRSTRNSPSGMNPS